MSQPTAGSSSHPLRKKISLKLKKPDKDDGRRRAKKASKRGYSSTDDSCKTEDSVDDIELSSVSATGPPEPTHQSQQLDWSHVVNMIGQKVVNPLIHCCRQCRLPILVYGRMIPCKHIFCFDCAKTTEKNCSRCDEPVLRIEQSALGTVFVCTYGGTKHGVSGCHRSYLSERDLQAHVEYRHLRHAQPAGADGDGKSSGADVSANRTTSSQHLQSSLHGHVQMPPPPLQVHAQSMTALPPQAVPPQLQGMLPTGCMLPHMQAAMQSQMQVPLMQAHATIPPPMPGMRPMLPGRGTVPPPQMQVSDNSAQMSTILQHNIVNSQMQQPMLRGPANMQPGIQVHILSPLQASASNILTSLPPPSLPVSNQSISAGGVVQMMDPHTMSAMSSSSRTNLIRIPMQEEHDYKGMAVLPGSYPPDYSNPPPPVVSSDTFAQSIPSASLQTASAMNNMPINYSTARAAYQDLAQTQPIYPCAVQPIAGWSNSECSPAGIHQPPPAMGMQLANIVQQPSAVAPPIGTPPPCLTHPMMPPPITTNAMRSMHPTGMTPPNIAQNNPPRPYFQ